jgi:transposase
MVDGWDGDRLVSPSYVAAREADGPARRSAPPTLPRFSVRQTSWLLLRSPQELEQDERAYLAALGQRWPQADLAGELARAFLALVRQRDHAALQPWVEQVGHGDLPELRSFAVGLRRDWAAVNAGLELPWSSGQTEGRVNRLKLLKRKTYGRATLAFLRRRFLLTA